MSSTKRNHRERRLYFSNLSNPWQRFRSRTGMSQTDVAVLLGIGQTAISQYESGSAPDPAIAKKFTTLCRQHRIPCSMDELYATMPG